MSSDWDELIARARERAETSPVPEEWGYRIKLEEGDHFAGRWRGETVDDKNTDDDGKPKRIFLFWDGDDAACFSRTYAALAREIDRVQPTIGCTIVIYRGGDYVGQQGAGDSFGVATEPNEFRRRGVFRALYAQAQALSKQRGGVCGLRLYVDMHNGRAQETYRRCGMHETTYRMFEVDNVIPRLR